MYSQYTLNINEYVINFEDISMFQSEEDEWLIFNKRTNGWVLMDSSELALLYHPDGLDESEFSEELFNLGIVQKNRQYVYIKPDDIDQGLYLFELNITDQCNLRCSYCLSNFMNEEHSYGMMSIEVAKQFCDQLENYVTKRDVPFIVIEFSGGEPLLNFKIIQYVIERLTGLSIKVVFNIQTNGMSINKEHLSFLAKHKNIQIAISLDGITEEHNKNRITANNENAYPHIMKSYRLIREYDIPITFVTVITNDNFNDIRDIVEFYIQEGIYNFSLLPMMQLGNGKKKSPLLEEKYIEELWSIHENVLSKKYSLKEKVPLERNLGVWFAYLLQPERNFMCQRSPCGAGINIISIAPNGDIYPCYGFQGIQEFMIGNVKEIEFSNVDQSPVTSLLKQRTVENLDECSSCNYQIWCQGGCPSNAYLSSNTLLEKDRLKCEMNSKMIEKCLAELKKPENIDYIKEISKTWMRGN